jgi:PAS domain S-box-containing protein
MAAVEMLASLRGSKLGLRSHLFIFGLAIVVPVLAYSAFLLHRYAQSVHVSNERRVLEIARALNADVDREITAVITTLETLATSRSLEYGDFADFYAQAKEALRSRSWHVVLIDAKGQQLVNTRVRWGAPLPRAEATEYDLPRIARETQQPYVTDLFRDTVAGRPIFAVSVPVRKGKETPYALVMSLEPELLIDIVKGESLPPGWLAAVADRKSMNMARSRLPGEFLGKPIPEESRRQSADRQEGVITTTDFEGQRSLLAFHWSKLTGWRVATWAPLALVEDQPREAWMLFFWSGAALLSLSLLLAFGVGRLMSRPMSQLMHAGAALGEGAPVTPIASTLREADELSLVLSNAARELHARLGAQAHLAAIVTSSASAIVSLSPDGIIRTWNPTATSVFGYEADEAIGRPVHILCPEGAREAFDKLYASVRSGSIVHADVVRRHKDGRMIDVSVNVAPMHDEAGHLVGISSINRDIAERKTRERHIDFLMRELAHRSKNMLAVVQAIAGQTVHYSPSLDEFQARFSQRLSAMARTQDLLVGRDWQGASMSELVRAQLAPFAEKAHARIDISGPELELKPNVVHSLTLALHELATNAAKYGALSVPDGRVAIRWDLDAPDGGAGRFRMCWRETDGPPVAPPAKKGFGHVVISEMVASSLRGEVKLDYAAQGLQWSIDMPSSDVLHGA